MLKKLMFSAVLTMPMSTVFANFGEVRNIDDLRNLCQTLEAKEQVKLFDKGILCKGSHTVWKKKTVAGTLSNTSKVEAVTSYEKSAVPLATDGNLTTTQVESPMTCNVYEQFKVSAPQVPVHLNSCSDLTVEKVEELCRESINEHCDESIQAKTETHPALEGEENSPAEENTECTMEFVKSFNTCDLYAK